MMGKITTVLVLVGRETVEVQHEAPEPVKPAV